MPISPAGSRNLPSVRLIVALLLVAGLSVALRLNLIDIPLNRDEGSFAYVGNMLAHGGALYRDALDHKPPGIWLVYWAIGHITDFNAASLHVFLLLYNLLVLLAVVVLVRRIVALGRNTSERVEQQAAVWAGLVYAVTSSASQIEGHSASIEMLMLLPIVVAAYLCLDPSQAGSRAKLRLGAAGALVAAAFWMKQPSVVIGLFLAVYVSWCASFAQPSGARPQNRLRKAAAALGPLCVGLAVPTLSLCFYLAATGRWSDFVYWSFSHNLSYVASEQQESLLVQVGARLASTMAANPVAWALAGVGCVLELRRNRAAGVFVTGLFLSSLIAGCHSPLMYRHYLASAMPALSIAAGIGIASLLALVPSRQIWRPMVAAAAVLGTVALPIFIERHYYLLDSPTTTSRRLYGANPFPESPLVAKYVAARTRPDEPLLILGSEPQILALAKRPSATRHLFMYQVVGPYPRALQSQREVLEDAHRADPPYVVLVNLEESWFPDEHGSGEFELKVRDWLRERYSPEAVVEKSRQEPTVVELSRLSEQDRQGALERARLLILRRAGERPGRSN